MAEAGSNRETEIKLRVASVEAARRLIEGGGFSVTIARHFESNVLYDTPCATLRERGQILRVREVDGNPPLLTYKGPSEPGRHKSREELELNLSDAAGFGEILGRIGMTPAFRYEKYRTEYQRPGDTGIVTLDETPIGVFLELEGDPIWIDATAAALGYSVDDYVLLSYGRLFLEARRADPSLPLQMVFTEDQW